MIGAMRTKMGPKVIGGVIAVIAFVFIFYGIFMPGSGGQGQTVAGEVNGETISYSEFSRAFNQRVEFFKSLMGGKISDEQLEQFHVREAVFQDLAQKKVLGQVAKKEGFYPSGEQVREQILKMDAFKKDGHFDKVQYKNVLTANQYTPTRFEDLIAQDIMEQNFKGFISQLAYVSDDEVSKELKTAKDRKKVKYVYIDNESARKMLPKDLKVEEQGKKLDEKVASLTAEILPALSNKGDAKINALLKDQKITVKTSEWLNSQSLVIPGVGSVKSIQNDLFSQKKGAPAKKYTLMGGTFYAMVADEEAFDPAKVTAKERAETLSKLQNQRQGDIMSEYTKALMKKASVSRNDRVVVGGKGSAAPVSPGARSPAPAIPRRSRSPPRPRPAHARGLCARPTAHSNKLCDLNY